MQNARVALSVKQTMRKIYELDNRDIVPTPLEILMQQKATERPMSPRIMQLMDDAVGIFQDLAQPRGLMEDFNTGGFTDLYEGDSLNAPDGPVPSIVSRATAAALMAVTMGETLAVKCNELFAQGSASLGYMLNMVSSAGSERMGRRMCGLFLERLRSEPLETEINDIKVQYYCPGHCGWHISGQEKLFAALRPYEIGISINAHWVMHPFKSISGILAAAPIEVHRFQQDFSFCPQCREHNCVERLRLLETE